MRALTSLLLVALGLCATGCQRHSYVLVTSTGHSTLAATSLLLRATNAGRTAEVVVEPTRDPYSFSLSFDPDRSGEVEIEVHLRVGSTSVLVAPTQIVTLRPGGVVPVNVTFAAGLTDAGVPLDLTGVVVDQTTPTTPDLADLAVPPDLRGALPDFTVPIDLADLARSMDQTLLDFTLGGPRCRALATSNSMTFAAAVQPTMAFDFNGAFTVEAWVNPGSITNNMGAAIIEHGPLPNERGYLLALGQGRELQFHVFTSNAPPNNHFTIFSTSAVPVGQWSHVAGTYDSGSKMMIIYLNGVAVGTRSNVLGTVLYASPASGLVMGNNMNGYLDEVRVSNVVRYTGNFTPAITFASDGSTRALFHFDEGSGSSAVDSFGGGSAMIMNPGFLTAFAPCQ